MVRLTRPGWWRRNAVALIALAVTTGATLVVAVLVPYQNWASDHRDPARVRAGDTARLAGAEFTLEKAGVFHEDGSPGVDVPEHAVLLAVLIRVSSPRKLPATCSVRLARTGTDPVSWDPVTSPSEFDYGLSDSTVHVCSLDDASGSRTLEEVFLVPQTALEHVTVEVSATLKKGASGSRETVALELPAKPYSDTAG